MQFSEILNLVLGGGCIASLVAIFTLRATVRKANAEAERAKAEAETVRIDNAEHATRILIEDILKPLRDELNTVREELNATRKDLHSAKREMARLRKAIDDANRCEHRNECPVLFGLRELPKGTKDDNPTVGANRSPPRNATVD